MPVVHAPNRDCSLVPTGDSVTAAINNAVSDEHVQGPIQEKIHGTEAHLSLGQWLHLSATELSNAVRHDFVHQATAEYDFEMNACLERLSTLPDGVRSALSTTIFSGECHQWHGRHDLGHLSTVRLHYTGLKAALAGVAATAPNSPDRVAVNASLTVDGHHYFVYLSSQGNHGERPMYFGVQDDKTWILETTVPCPQQVAEQVVRNYEPTAEVVTSSLTARPIGRIASWLYDEFRHLIAS